MDIRASLRRLARGVCLTAVILLAVTALCSCRKPAENPTPGQLAPIRAGNGEAPPALPKKDEQPNIKIRRNKDGSYGWEVTGRDVGAVLKADRALDRALGNKKGGRPGAEEE